MESLSPSEERQAWIIEPLIDAGMELEEIEALLIQAAFEALVGAPGLDLDLPGLVAGRAVHLRAAWLETVRRLIAAGGPGG